MRYGFNLTPARHFWIHSHPTCNTILRFFDTSILQYFNLPWPKALPSKVQISSIRISTGEKRLRAPCFPLLAVFKRTHLLGARALGVVTYLVVPLLLISRWSLYSRLPREMLLGRLLLLARAQPFLASKLQTKSGNKPMI